MNSLMTAFVWLTFAIASEIIGTLLLASSQQFTRLYPSLGVILFYGLAFYALSHSLKVIPVGISYAIWSGVGIVAISFIGHFFLRQKIDLAAAMGIGLIIAGVLVINIFSKSISH